MTIQSGEFWVANIPFTNGIDSKKRPVLILWLDGNDAIVAVFTSAKPRNKTDVLLKDWAIGCLKVACIVRLSRLNCLEKSLFLSRIGTIYNNDAQRIKNIWNTEIKLKF